MSEEAVVEVPVAPVAAVPAEPVVDTSATPAVETPPPAPPTAEEIRADPGILIAVLGMNSGITLPAILPAP